MIIQEVEIIKNDINETLGTTKEDLEWECETTTCYSIAWLYPRKMFKVEGLFNNIPHFWLEYENEIIDLSIEQFDQKFNYPLESNLKDLYKPIKKDIVDENIYNDSLEISRVSGFYI